MSRNRAEGWTHAKLSGHQNEELVLKYIKKNTNILCKQFNKNKIKDIQCDGIKEKNVMSVLGDSTKSKTDIKIVWDDNSITNVSIKKSLGGQAYLISVDRFIKGYEKQYGCVIHKDVKEALRLFFGEREDIIDILNQKNLLPKTNEDVNNRKYEIRKNRLIWTSLERYNKHYADFLIKWLKENIENISDFCFSKGLVKEKENWANSVWYINLIGEGKFNLIISVEVINKKCAENKDKIVVGKRNGGTTIILPFGFVQWHQGQMQFHHKYNSLTTMINYKLQSELKK